MQEEQQKQIMEYKMTNTYITANHTYVHAYHMYTTWSSSFDIYNNTLINLWTYSKQASTHLSPTSFYHVPHIKLSTVPFSNYDQQTNGDFSAHRAFHYSHTSNAESLHEATQKLYTHFISITWKTNTCTNRTITPLPTYKLCLSRKGCRARGTTKANHGVKNDKYVHYS